MPTLRPYHPNDAAALTALYVRSVRHYGPRAYTPEQVAVWAATADVAHTAARCGDGRHEVVAQDEAGRLLGFADLEADGHLDMLYVAPEAEGLHVGSHLYGAIEAHARRRGLRRRQQGGRNARGERPPRSAASASGRSPALTFARSRHCPG